MSDNLTRPSNADIGQFLDSVEPARRRQDARTLDGLFRDVTGFAPVLWGTSIVGYGRYHYRYDSGREGDFLATGFAPRKANLVVYVMPGYADFGDILVRLGPHERGRSCLYLAALSKIDLDALADLIRAGLADLGRHWPVEPT